MSLVKKLKDILFEVEEDDTEPVKIQKETRIEEKKKKTVANEPIEIKKDLSKDFQDDIDFEINTETKKEEVIEESKTPSERNLFTKDNAFKFPDFDEEEFQSNMSRSKQNTNVLDYERKKTNEKKNEYRSYERLERDNRNDEKRKFKPSPIISPVYGILNQDYNADDIVNKNNDVNIDIDSVRKKAFEVKKEKIITETLDVIETPNINDIINDTYEVGHNTDHNDLIDKTIDEPVVSFFDEKNIKEEIKEEKKTVDDLLESASLEISLEDTLEVPTTNNLDAIEEELEKIEDEDKEENKDLDDTLDNDLFELIDSMYDEREEGN